MMRRHALLAGLVAVLSAGAAAADTATVDRIMRELRGLGYAQVSVERTLLGRARILAAGPDATREIIVNPNTGEILRDLWLPHSGSNGGGSSGGSGGLIDTASPDNGDDDNSGSGKADDDDDDDNDDNDDDDHGDDDGRDGDGGGGDNDSDGEGDGGGGRGRGRDDN